MVVEAEQFFQPVDHHLDIERRFSRMIRQGYVGRNPVVWGYWRYKLDSVEAMRKHLKEGVQPTAGSAGQDTEADGTTLAQVEESNANTVIAEELGEVPFSDYEDAPDEEESSFTKRIRRLCSTALGFAILGLSGMGKSLAVEQILKEFYDQVIFHTMWNGMAFPHVQLVWLKLDCPSNGSVKSLCLHFFKTVDAILDTNYYALYARNGKASAEQMMPFVAGVAAAHSLGVLVIDEIQNLAAVSSGGAERLINFVVELINTIGVPVVLVGTNQAYHAGIFSKFRQARRASGQGDKYWDRMQFYAKDTEHLAEDERPLDATWQLFTETLWDLRFLKSTEPKEDPESELGESKVDRSLSRALYDVSQGITFFAVKAFFLAQIRAIEAANLSSVSSHGGVPAREELTDVLFLSVLDTLRLASPMLDALREPNQTVLDAATDIKPIDLSYFAAQAITRLQQQALIQARREARDRIAPLHSHSNGKVGVTKDPATVEGSQEQQTTSAQPMQPGKPSGTQHRSKSSEDTTMSAEGIINEKVKERLRRPKNGSHHTATGNSNANGKSQLAQLVAEGQQQGLSGHQVLVEAGMMYTIPTEGEGQA